MADDNKTPNATSTAKPAAAEPTKAAAPAKSTRSEERRVGKEC